MWRSILIAGSSLVLAAPAADAATVSSYVRYAEGEDAVHLDISPGGQRTIQPGVYDGVGRGLGPNLTVVGGCTQEDGRFEVLDYAAGPDRKVTRAWILFEERCYKREVHYGELRINQPVSDAPGYAVPGIVRWGAGDPGRPRYDAPVSVYATGPAQVTGATIDGPDAASFAVTVNNCAGTTLAAGQRCYIFTHFRADGPGARMARLTITFAGGATQVVPLQGFTYGGRSGLTLTPEPGEPVTQGTPRNYTAGADGLSAHESAGGFRFAVDGANDSWWYIDVAAPEGGTLAPGRYTGATGGGGSAPKLRISGEGRSCGGGSAGEFTITDFKRAFDGRLQSVGATFESRCPTGGALRGTMEWRAGNAAAPAPWMGSGPYTPTPSGGGSGGAPPASQLPSSTPAAGTLDCSALPIRRVATAGAERLIGGPGRDRLLGGPGHDCLDGAAGNDRLRGGPGNDRLTGGAGRDDLRGESGNDTLRGGAGNDRLAGGPGRDVLDCGRGRDVVVAGKGDLVRGCERVLR